MGGCASRPKNLGAMASAPVPAPTSIEKSQPQAIPQQESNGDVIKEEPLVDQVSKPAEEAASNKEDIIEEYSNRAAQIAESKAGEAKTEAAATAEPEKQHEPKTKEVVAAPVITSTGAAATAATTTPNEAQKSNDKSDAPPVTV